jgi:transposase InsO family protein
VKSIRYSWLHTRKKRNGSPLDNHRSINAVAESFWATLKKEFIHLRPFDTIARLRRETFEYIEGYYNTKRIHSSLHYLTPTEYEEQFKMRLLHIA